MSLLPLANSPDGFALNLMIGLNGNQTAALQMAGAAILPPLSLRGIIDTGSDVTAVASRVIQYLGQAAKATASTQTAGGVRTVNLYEVSLSISGPRGSGGPMLVLPNLLVTELTALLPNIEVLVGRDILAQCLFVADGPGQRFTLAW